MTPEMFRKLAALGLSHDQMAGVLEIFEADAEVRKEKARSRVQKWRDKKRDETQRNVTEHNETQQADSREGIARGEDNLQNKILSGENKKTNTTTIKARADDLSAFKTELSDLDPDRIDAIVKHRRMKRGQLTAHAARLFRSDAKACGLSLSDAVDTCISRNWITVKPEYLAGRSRQATSPPPRERTVSDALAEMAAGTWKGPPGLRTIDEPDFPTIETSFSRRD